VITGQYGALGSRATFLDVDQERRSQWLRGVLDMCVLAMLATRETYGYQLARALDLAGLGPIRGGTLYPVLLRLQRTGLIIGDWREGESGPARKYYRITDDGQRALRESGRDWQVFVDQVGDVLGEAVTR
jgi:PadR family transcriptional regulator PadR